MLAAIDQKEVMLAAMGRCRIPGGADGFHRSPACRQPPKPAWATVRKRKTLDELKRMVNNPAMPASGLRFCIPPTSSSTHAVSTVAVDAFRKIGVNVDEQMVDWGTVVQRRTSKEPVDKGGWSMFPAGAPAPEMVDPMLSKRHAQQRGESLVRLARRPENRGGV